MRYELKDQMGTVIAKGDQLDLNIRVDLENSTMQVQSAGGLINTVCDICGQDKFTLTFKND